MMSDYERLLSAFAELTESSIGKAFRQAKEKYEWVDSIEEAKSLMSRLRGTLIASICGEIEEKLGRNFSSFIPQLPDTPTRRTQSFWHASMPNGSTLRGRAKIMWAIRIAYTHGNGKYSQINDPQVAQYLNETHFDGISIENDKIVLSGRIAFPAVRTAVDIYERFK